MDTTPPKEPSSRVSIVDIDMPFGSMVIFMVKWSIATIPGVIILVAVGAFIFAFVSAAIGGVTALTGNSISPAYEEEFPAAFEPTASGLRGVVQARQLPCAEAATTPIRLVGRTRLNSVWRLQCPDGNLYDITLSPDGSVEDVRRPR